MYFMHLVFHSTKTHAEERYFKFMQTGNIVDQTYLSTIQTKLLLEHFLGPVVQS